MRQWIKRIDGVSIVQCAVLLFVIVINEPLNDWLNEKVFTVENTMSFLPRYLVQRWGFGLLYSIALHLRSIVYTVKARKFVLNPQYLIVALGLILYWCFSYYWRITQLFYYVAATWLLIRAFVQTEN